MRRALTSAGPRRLFSSEAFAETLRQRTVAATTSSGSLKSSAMGLVSRGIGKARAVSPGLPDPFLLLGFSTFCFYAPSFLIPAVVGSHEANPTWDQERFGPLKEKVGTPYFLTGTIVGAEFNFEIEDIGEVPTLKEIDEDGEASEDDDEGEGGGDDDDEDEDDEDDE